VKVLAYTVKGCVVSQTQEEGSNAGEPKTLTNIHLVIDFECQAKGFI